ncbi:MAG: XdhC family protein [Thermoleophilia bacterium]|nr:XdhC family protein [Thermoleophilia bacterium]
MNLDTARTGLSLLEKGEDFAWVTILDTLGSSPRHAGATMLVKADGSIAGTIGGGPLEARATERALELLKTGGFYIERFDAAQLGMMCGGGGSLLIERVGSNRSTAQEFFRVLVALLETGRKGWLVTLVPEDAGPENTPGEAVRRCLVGADGSVAGDPVCAPEALQELAKKGGTYDRILATAPSVTHVQPVGAQGAAYVFGAGHCGEKLAPVLSSLGFFTVVVDDRPDFASPERFPTADRLVVPASFDNVVGTLPIDEESYLVIVTRGHSHDTCVLAQSLGTKARYIGMIGSKKKVADAFRDLSGQGFSGDDLARVHAPIGLSIGAETPEEIAISIAAELIQVRAARS